MPQYRSTASTYPPSVDAEQFSGTCTNEDVESFMSLLTNPYLVALLTRGGNVASSPTEAYHNLPRETRDQFTAIYKGIIDVIVDIRNGTRREEFGAFKDKMMKNVYIQQIKHSLCGTDGLPSVEDAIDHYRIIDDYNPSNTAIEETDGSLFTPNKLGRVDSGLGGISFPGSRENTARLSTPDSQLEHLESLRVEVD
ncbi:uncharacterized protein L203_102160 [Cryptococcus depauperatus CBS 7841]|uniref:Uncharacterized protein n=1 Tax=Cryptococcus depauperatus CBS 7841 TaxID=1295531 RepID=A0A1E3IRG9_9TREE|nr:hypothetical protein L203_01416 [Cryptococcus depauperatus CBS 7841]